MPDRCSPGRITRSGRLRRALAFLHPEDSIRKGLIILRIGSIQSILIKNGRVGQLLSHQFDFLFLLVFLCLLADFEEVRVEHLVRVKRLRVRIVLLIVCLVHPLKLIVSLGNSRN